MSVNNNDWLFSFKCAVCSFFANYVAGVFHPLELLKTRIQSHDGTPNNAVPQYNGILRGFKDIYRAEGIDGLFKGIHLTMFSQAASSALFFMIYESMKKSYEDSGYSRMESTAYASAQASIVCTLITQPIWVIKTRVLLNTQPKIGELENIITKTKDIWRQGGLRGFYSGLSMNLILSQAGLLQMYSYEACKMLYDQFLPSSYGEKNFICGGVSKIVTTFLTFPMTTVRTRIQQDQFYNSTDAKYKNVMDVISKMWRMEGVGGFFKGLAPNLIRGIPHRGLYFYFYEVFKGWMNVGSSE